MVPAREGGAEIGLPAGTAPLPCLGMTMETYICLPVSYLSSDNLPTSSPSHPPSMHASTLRA